MLVPQGKRAVFAILIVWTALPIGCSKSEPPPTKGLGNEVAAVLAVPAQDTAKPVALPKGESFEEATLSEPPEGQLRPPDKTVAGKDVARMYEQVTGAGGVWNQIAF